MQKPCALPNAQGFLLLIWYFIKPDGHTGNRSTFPKSFAKKLTVIINWPLLNVYTISHHDYMFNQL